MGYYAHKTLIVTGTATTSHFKNALNKAKELFAINENGDDVEMVSNPLKGFNQLETFMIAPDGSKEDWEKSDFFDKKMEEMIKYLKSPECAYDDKSSYNDWVLVEYGDTGRRVLKSNCTNKF